MRPSFMRLHQLQTAAEWGRILVLINDRVLGRGSRSALLDSGGVCRDVWQAQFVGDEPKFEFAAALLD